MGDTRGINHRKKYFVKKLHNFRCNHCNEKKSSEELEIDHIFPVAMGGNNDYSNLQPLCIECHIKKTKGEWEEGFDKEKINDFTQEEKLEILEDYLKENKKYSYEETQFLVLNHKVLSKFCYNSNVLNLLYKKANGITFRNYDKRKYREQRDIMIYVLRKELKMSYKKIANILLDYEFDISYAQVRNICAKFGDSEKEKDLKEEKQEN